VSRARQSPDQLRPAAASGGCLVPTVRCRPDRRIHLASAGQQISLPGMLWPAGCDRGQGNPLFFSKVVAAGFGVMTDRSGEEPLVSAASSRGTGSYPLAEGGGANA